MLYHLLNAQTLPITVTLKCLFYYGDNKLRQLNKLAVPQNRTTFFSLRDNQNVTTESFELVTSKPLRIQQNLNGISGYDRLRFQQLKDVYRKMPAFYSYSDSDKQIKLFFSQD